MRLEAQTASMEKIKIFKVRKEQVGFSNPMNCVRISISVISFVNNI